MFSEFLNSIPTSPNAYSKPNSLGQTNGKAPASAACYDPRATQNLQKFIAAMSNTFNEVLKISTVIQENLAGSAVLEERNQQTPAKGEARAAQQQSMSAKTSLTATAASSKNEARLQPATQSKDSPKIYAGNENEALKQVRGQEGRGQEYIADRETSAATLDDDAQCALASHKNGSEDSANHQRRSKTFLTETEWEKIRNGQNEISLSLMNYSAAPQSLSATANQFSLKSASSYSVNNSSPSVSFSEGNTMGWLMHLFEGIRDSALKVMQLLGQTAEGNIAKVNRITKAGQDIKEALKNIAEDKEWQWGDKVLDEHGEPVLDEDGYPVYTPKEKYKEIFRTMQEYDIKIGGLDVLEWLKKRSKEIPDPPEQSALERWRTHLQEDHGYSLKKGWNEMTEIEVIHRKNAGCTHTYDDLQNEDKAREGQGHPGWVLKGDLLLLSTTLEDAAAAQQDANTNLQQKISYQNQLYQGFQTAIVNTGLIIAELMKMAFSKMAI